MEVASPLSFAPSSCKRSFATYPTAQMMENGNCGPMEECYDHFQQRAVKRRRFRTDESIEAPSPSPFAAGPFGSNHNRMMSPAAGHLLKRGRATSPAAEELNRVVSEQAAVIESLKTEKKDLQGSLESLKTEHERVQKENYILRKAVQIQQDRQNHAEHELKNAQKYREGAEEQMRKMEQMILSLRYHLQARHTSSNDFMGMPPPSVF